MVKKPLSGWKRAALNIFIVANVAVIFFWGLPASAFRSMMVKPVDKYVNYVGLWHSWSMFAPNPLRTNFDIRAQVKYLDGTEAEWIAPRMQELSQWDRAAKERHRKWRERIRTDEHSRIWKETAHYIARQMNRRPNNPPVQVKLTRYWAEIPAPTKGDFQPMPKSYSLTRSYTYATIPISHKDL